MTNEIIRVGIVGAGANTVNHHIPGLQAIDGVEVISVCNRSRESSERVATQFGVPTVYEDWHTLVAAPDTDDAHRVSSQYDGFRKTFTASEAVFVDVQSRLEKTR